MQPRRERSREQQFCSICRQVCHFFSSIDFDSVDIFFYGLIICFVLIFFGSVCEWRFDFTLISIFFSILDSLFFCSVYFFDFVYFSEVSKSFNFRLLLPDWTHWCVGNQGHSRSLRAVLRHQKSTAFASYLPMH